MNTNKTKLPRNYRKNKKNARLPMPFRTGTPLTGQAHEFLGCSKLPPEFRSCQEAVPEVRV